MPSVCLPLAGAKNANTIYTVKSAIPSNTPFLLPWRAVPNLKAFFKIVQKNKDGSDVVFESDQMLGYFLDGSPIPSLGSDGDMVILGAHDGRLFDGK